MPDIPPSTSEADRLRALHRLQLLDTEPEAVFDALTRLAARLLGTPIALITLVDASRQWFKSRHGLDRSETARNEAICAHTIQRREPLIVNDASLDERFAGNPLVVGDIRIRAYAGVPLISLDGFALGALCAIDHQPRQFTPDDVAVLRDLAVIAQREIQHREACLRLCELAAQQYAPAAPEPHDRVALTDPLTGLPNRLLLDDRLSVALAKAQRAGCCLGVAVVEVSGFKGVNERLGRQAGDELLLAVARRLSGLLRGDDTVARLDGDRFALLLNQLGRPLEGQQVLSRVCDAMAEAVMFSDGRTAHVSASVGVAFYPFESSDGSTLLAMAEQALCEARSARWPLGAVSRAARPASP